MIITLTINNTSITLENENTAELMALLNKIVNNNSTAPTIRDEFKQSLQSVIPPQNPPSYRVPVNTGFIPCSDKQKKLLRSIPEYKNADLNSVSKQEASMAIETWNKSRAYHYKDHY